MKRLALLVVLVCALGAGFGCSSKSASTGEVPPVESHWTPQEQTAIQQITDGRVHFEFNKYVITAEGKQVLAQKAELMKANPRIRVRIEGNCDERGTQEYNLALGERRARAAFEYLVLLGVNPAQMELLSFGKENPIVSGTGEAVWAQNRRDDFKVINY